MQQESSSAIALLNQQLQGEIGNLRSQIDDLTDQLSNKSEEVEVVEVRQESKSAIALLNQQLQGEIGNLRSQIDDLTDQLSNKSEEVEVAEIRQESQSAIALLNEQLQGEIGNLRFQIDDLVEQVSDKSEAAALAEIQQNTNSAIDQLNQQLQGEIINLRSGLNDLNQQFSSRPEVEAIANLSEALAAIQPPQIEDWPHIKIKVIGVGGAGEKAINRAMASRLIGVEFLCINTDAQELAQSFAPNILQIGQNLTQGMSAGADPTTGEQAAKESRQEIAAAIEQSDIVFIVAGMGGGTGTGAAPIIAEIAKEKGALTVGIVTLPFVHEGRRRIEKANEGIADLQNKADVLIAITIDKVLTTISEWTPIKEAFRVVDDLLCQAVEAISDIINVPGLVNVDFGNLRKAIASSGIAQIGIGQGSGKSRAKSAAMAAISSPLLSGSIKEAKTVIFHIKGSSDMSLQEVNTAAETINEYLNAKANIMFGADIDDRLQDEVRVTLIATGLAGR
ncbi:cell division protein FtsZ [Planktothrix sp. FACHB-1355]|uniref:Cell division protein FtsZ n=2 Tax=Cyanophyceae TaxID=3028117 RepID=A0A926ZGE8_9CYAN|nr:cell division protein FtsZ [Aerosakkonema funiforme FACHB-1375]MBD3559181.1 cell division protein FtsZ [Planktothrix sp. FACHB-1355]